MNLGSTEVMRIQDWVTVDAVAAVALSVLEVALVLEVVQGAPVVSAMMEILLLKRLTSL